MSEGGSWNGLSISIPLRIPIRGRLSGSAPSLTFGAQTGRGSDRSCVIKRTFHHQFDPLIALVHELAQNAVGPMLPYLGFQILRLGVGQSLNQHRDYHNHPDYPNHTLKFGKYMGGSLQMLIKWYSYDTENQWLSFDALKVVHKVTPVTQGERYLRPSFLQFLVSLRELQTRPNSHLTAPDASRKPKQTCTNSHPHALFCELQTGTNLPKFAPRRKRPSCAELINRIAIISLQIAVI